MGKHSPDIVIIGAGIAGLWTFHRLRKLGYDAVLLENKAIGGGQTIASQGILHSGLKYALAGKVNEAARNIVAMPNRWRDAMNTGEEVDLTRARALTESQILLTPKGIMGGVTKMIAQRMLSATTPLLNDSVMRDLNGAGYRGTGVSMNELVLDIPTVIRSLAAPYREYIINAPPEDFTPKITIQTAAASNAKIAAHCGHDAGLKTQARPLLMGMVSPAPFALYAHLVSTREKPVATITTHYLRNGSYMWYIGGYVAERAKDASPAHLYRDIKKALKRYLPALDLSQIKWANLPIDRIEGTSNKLGNAPDTIAGNTIGNNAGRMPGTPTIFAADDALYCWPTKLTFAPLLSDMVLMHLGRRGITPRAQGHDYGAYPSVDFSAPPWESAKWESYNDD